MFPLGWGERVGGTSLELSSFHFGPVSLPLLHAAPL